MVFGSITGLGQRSLDDTEGAAFELGLSTSQVNALQQVAFETLAGSGAVKPNPLKPAKAGGPMNCPRWR